MLSTPATGGRSGPGDFNKETAPMWQQVIDTLRDEFSDLPDATQWTRLLVRLGLAVLLGALIGYEREQRESAAGLRTHMLVCVGTTIILMTARLDGIPLGEMSKVIEGVVAGIGFLGGGVILKLTSEREIRGITTAASIWTTAAIGIAVGLGQVWIAFVSLLIVWLILFVIGYVEKKVWGMNDDNA
jgi:putative Mg2+ transporter-C (MgtC) family protein